MSDTRTQFTRGASLAFALHLAAMGTSFVAQLVYARWMSQEAFGVFSQVNAALILAANLLIIGVPMVNLRHLPTFVQQGDWARWRGMMRWGLRRVALLSAAVGICWAMAAAMQEAPTAWIIGGLLLPTLSVIAVQQTQALGFKDVLLARLPSEILRPAVALALFAGVVAAGIQPGATLALITALVAGVLTLGVLAARIEQLPPDAAIGVRPLVESREWGNTSAEFFGQGFFSMALDRADLLVVGWTLGPTHAAVYAVVIMLAKLLLFALSAVNTIAAPMFSDLYAQRRFSEVQDVLRMGVVAGSSTAVAGALFLGLFAVPVLSVFGEGYAIGATALWITLIGSLVNAFCGSVGNLVGMAGHQHITWRVMGVAAVGMVALDFLLIPPLGLEGAALARSIAMIGWNVVLAGYAIRTLHLDPTIRSALAP